MECLNYVRRRLVFSLAGACNSYYDLALKSGRHLPPDQETTELPEAVKLKWASVSFAKSEQINRSGSFYRFCGLNLLRRYLLSWRFCNYYCRYRRNPGGVSVGVRPEFDPKVDVEHRDKDTTSAFYPGLCGQKVGAASYSF